ncbi:MAG: hydroxyethylthiazole kinase [Dethiobacter sp.]|nr:MAG: hydroxyethylthiazole kinase [Dethiobacter sp.]
MWRGFEILTVIRREKPLIHHITNYVTAGDCASITTSIGALPVMAHALEEVEEMLGAARAAVINIGTLFPLQVDSMVELGKKSREKGIPVVLDPVGTGATAFRTKIARLLLEEATPPIVKGNEAEIGSLAGIKEVKICGVQSLDGGIDPLESARRLREMLNYNAVVAVTGPVDVVTDGKRAARIFNGHTLMPLVVGSGCMAASLVAAFAAVEKDYFLAASSALAAMGVAGEIAAETGEERKLPGPAEYKIRLLDALFHLTPQEFARRARIELM